MAISRNFFGIRRGQAAGLVFQGNYDAKGVAVQVTRGQAEAIANPQSYGQAQQRARMAAASKLASIFAQVIDHSTEGLRFGQPNRSRFVADCLKASKDAVYTGPYMTKGETSVKLPADFVVELSKGSLPEIPVSLASTVVPATEMTEGIMADFALQTGDILTMVLIYENAAGQVSAGYKQVICKVGADLSTFGASFVASNTTSAAHLDYPSAQGLAQVLLIHERNTGSVYKRSTTMLRGFADVPNQTEASIASYMSDNSKRVYFGDKYLDGGEISDRYIDKASGAEGGGGAASNLLAVYLQNRMSSSADFGKYMLGLARQNSDGSYNIFYIEDEEKLFVGINGQATSYGELGTDGQFDGTVNVWIATASSAALVDSVSGLTSVTASWAEYNSSIGHL